MDRFSGFIGQLIHQGYATREQIKRAQIESQATSTPFLETLEKMTDQPLKPDLRSEYKREILSELEIQYGVEAFDPDQYSFQKIDELIHEFFSLELCRSYELIPVGVHPSHSSTFMVAMTNPGNLLAEDAVNRILHSRGFKLKRMAIALEDYRQLIRRCLDENAQRQEQSQSVEIDLSDDLDAIGGFEELNEGDGDMDLGAALQDAETAPIIGLVNKILAKALQEGVSAIHIEPQAENLRIRFRIDGVLSEAFPPLSRKIIPAVISRFKIISDLDIAERRQPQEGRIRRIYQGRKVDFRVSTLPSRFGEKVVLRILDNSSTQLGLDQLIPDPNRLEIVRNMVSRPSGLILVTGPDRSGKTTTLYSVLSECNHPGVNISTAEDPIEYTLPGLTQVQVIREKGMDFASVLHTFLRQDPDVILVGDIPDQATVMATLAAARRCLVLAAIPTESSVAAIGELQMMGCEDWAIARSLLGVIHQQLLRRLCFACRISARPTQDDLRLFGPMAASLSEVPLYQAKILTPQEREVAKVTKTLCPRCRGIGYQGRIAVHEVLSITQPMQRLIAQGCTAEVIEKAARDAGMKPLLESGLDLVRQGETTLEEIERVWF